MKKVKIYGSSSMAGHMISEYLSIIKNFKVDLVNEYDIIDKNYECKKNIIFSEPHPDYIINCIRCLVEESELNLTKAIIYNSYFPHLLGDYYKNSRTKIIHLSTDCVFSGEKGGYNEDSKHDGLSNYAKTKSLGEINNNKDITIRTSYLGPTIEPNNEELFDWFLLQKGEVNGYCDAIWNGLTTLALAKGISELIKLDYSGVYHMVSNEKISKYFLLSLVKKIWQKKDVEIKKTYINNIDRSLIDNQKLISVADYNSMFEELYEYMNKNKLKYKKYNII
jgi:dTDP-4-dehydrorhamnose reductase